jgi:hypothetical protein
MQDVQEFEKFAASRKASVANEPTEETMGSISDMDVGEVKSEDVRNARDYLQQFRSYMTNYWLPSCDAAVMTVKAGPNGEWNIALVPAIKKVLQHIELDVLNPVQIRETNASILYHATQIGKIMLILLDDGELDSHDSYQTAKEIVIDEVHSRLQKSNVKCKRRDINVRVFGPECSEYIDTGVGDFDSKTIITVEVQVPVHHLCIEFLRI